MAAIGSHLLAVTKLAAAWDATTTRAAQAVTAIKAATAARSSGDDAYQRLQDAAKAFGNQYASAAFNKEEEGSYAGGFLTAAYARDIVKMYAVALAIARNADGQLPGVLMEAYRSIGELERFWQWAGFASRYGSLESLALREMGTMPTASRNYGKKPTPGATAAPTGTPSGTASFTALKAMGGLR